MPIKLEVVKRSQEKELEGLIEQELKRANKKIGKITTPVKYNNAKVLFFESYNQFLSKKCPDGIPLEFVLAKGAQALTIEKENGPEMNFFLMEIKEVRDRTLLSDYICPNEVAHAYLMGKECDHSFYFGKEIYATEVFINEVHTELPADLLGIKAGYIEGEILNLQNRVKDILENSVEEELRAYNLSALGSNGKKKAYAFLVSSTFIYLEAFKKEIENLKLPLARETFYLNKLDESAIELFNKTSKEIEPNFLEYVREKGKTFSFTDYFSCQKISELISEFIKPAEQLLHVLL